MRIAHQRFLASVVLMFIGGFFSSASFWALAFMILGFGAGWCFHSGWVQLTQDRKTAR